MNTEATGGRCFVLAFRLIFLLSSLCSGSQAPPTPTVHYLTIHVMQSNEAVKATFRPASSDFPLHSHSFNEIILDFMLLGGHCLITPACSLIMKSANERWTLTKAELMRTSVSLWDRQAHSLPFGSSLAHISSYPSATSQTSQQGRSQEMKS